MPAAARCPPLHPRLAVTGAVRPQARRELEAASAGRADAAEAAAKLQRMVATVQAEMADAQAAADWCAPPARRLCSARRGRRLAPCWARRCGTLPPGSMPCRS